MGLDTKIVIVLRDGLAPQVAANAAAVLGLSLGGRLPHLLGPDGKDGSGAVHAGLNTHPVPVVTAPADQVRELHGKARGRDDVTVVGFTEVARRAREYGAYLDDLAMTAAPDLAFVGVALFGPRNRISALTKRFPLLGVAAEPDVAAGADAQPGTARRPAG
jgi:hypothetical protein